MLQTDFKHFTQRRLSDQSESHGSNFELWDDTSRSGKGSLFKWNIFGSSKSTESSTATGTSSNISCSDTTTLAPPVSLAANFWNYESTQSTPKFSCETFGISGTGGSEDPTPKTSLSVPRPTRPAPSHNYPNISQQLEVFLWSRKNSYTGTLNDSIYDGDISPVAKNVSKKSSSAGPIKKGFLDSKTRFTHAHALKRSSEAASDRDAWSLSGFTEDGQDCKGPLHLHGGPPGHFMVVQTTEITVEYD